MNDRRYVMNVAISNMSFWREPQHTWEKIGAVTPGLEMMFGGPTNSDVSKQIEELELLIEEGVSGLVIFSNDSTAVAPIINKAVDKGIPVVTAFADVPDSKRLAHIGTDQATLGASIAALAMKKYMTKKNHKPHVLVSIGGKSALDQMQRLDGIRNALGDCVEYLGYVEDNFTSADAEREIRRALRSHEDIDIIFGCNSQSAIGAVAALKDLREPGDVVVTAWDTEEEVMRQIKLGHQGWIHATAVLYSSYMVQVCFALLEAATFGYLYPDTLNTLELQLPAVPGKIEIPMKEVVTFNNVDEYLGKPL
jgi:ABC-type sugar transport system substrate-binding protein